MRERLYDATCLILSNATGGLNGKYTEPNPEFSFTAFASSLFGRAQAFTRMRKR